MSTRQSDASGSNLRGHLPARSAADRAYRRAWWSLALYPVSFAAAFFVGEGLLSLLVDEPADPAFWQVVVAGVPALLVFVAPGVLARAYGRAAQRLGRPEGSAPALVGTVIALAFVGINVTSYLAGLVFD